MENFHSIPEKHEKRESLAQQIFPRLRYFKVLQLHCKHVAKIWFHRLYTQICPEFLATLRLFLLIHGHEMILHSNA